MSEYPRTCDEWGCNRRGLISRVINDSRWGRVRLPLPTDEMIADRKGVPAHVFCGEHMTEMIADCRETAG